LVQTQVLEIILVKNDVRDLDDNNLFEKEELTVEQIKDCLDNLDRVSISDLTIAIHLLRFVRSGLR
jgi:hypothetical protein